MNEHQVTRGIRRNQRCKWQKWKWADHIATQANNRSHIKVSSVYGEGSCPEMPWSDNIEKYDGPNWKEATDDRDNGLERDE